MADSFIQFRAVRKAFGTKIVYHRFDLDIERDGCHHRRRLRRRQERHAQDAHRLLGPIGLDHFDGKEVTEMKPRALGAALRIAMLFQGGALFDSLNVSRQRRLRSRRALPLSNDTEEIEERIAGRSSRAWASSMCGRPICRAG
jgi:phospholipid/cholesterol/gamma-HCH transport system ATP-binding protein